MKLRSFAGSSPGHSAPNVGVKAGIRNAEVGGRRAEGGRQRTDRQEIVAHTSSVRPLSSFPLAIGAVQRFELPNLGALNFLLHESLDGGGTLSLKADAQGKTYSAALLRMEIDIPEDFLK